MSTRFTHQDVVAVTAESILTARRLRALRVVLCDDTHPSHLELVAVADMLIETENLPPAEFGYCCVCDRPGAPWQGKEYVHESCLADDEEGL